MNINRKMNYGRINVKSYTRQLRKKMALRIQDGVDTIKVSTILLFF